MKKILCLALCLNLSFLSAQPDVTLHLSPKWRECSFQLDPSLTQKQWHQFTEEAGLVAHFRPLVDAQPMGVGHYEFSMVQWTTGIDETQGAWNNTFVHPDSEHWLVGSEHLPFPGLTVRTGIAKNLDLGVYWGMRPGANYGFFGGQVQMNLLTDSMKNFALSNRIGFNNLYGPHDLNLTTIGYDVLASKSFRMYYKVLLNPYVGVSSYLTHTHEKSRLVNLKDETIPGLQGMLGATMEFWCMRFGIEYNVAKVQTVSCRVGANIRF